MKRYGSALCQFHYDAHKRELLASGRLLGRGRVDAGPVAEHIARLKRAGMHPHDIAHYSGVTTVTLWRVEKQDKVNADTAARIMGVKP